MSKETGGPAFPTSGDNYEKDYSSPGITIRDYFAAKAMQAWLSQIDPNEMEDMMYRWAENSYAFADVMLKARNQ